MNGKLEYVAHCWLACNSLMVRPPTSSDSSVPLALYYGSMMSHCPTVQWAGLVVSSPDPTPPQGKGSDDYYKLDSLYVLSSAVLISRKPMRSLVYVCHMTCGITKCMCSFTKKPSIGYQTLFPRRGVGSGDKTTGQIAKLYRWGDDFLPLYSFRGCS